MENFSFNPTVLLNDGFTCHTMDKDYRVSQGDKHSKSRNIISFEKNKDKFRIRISPETGNETQRSGTQKIKATLNLKNPEIDSFIKERRKKVVDILSYSNIMIYEMLAHSYTQAKNLTDSLFEKPKEQEPFIRQYGIEDLEKIKTLTEKLGLESRRIEGTQIDQYTIPISKKGSLLIIAGIQENLNSKQEEFSMRSIYQPKNSNSWYNMASTNFSVITDKFFNPRETEKKPEEILDQEERQFIINIYNTLNISPTNFLKQQIQLAHILEKESPRREIFKKEEAKLSPKKNERER